MATTSAQAEEVVTKLSASDYSQRTQHEQILKAPDTYIGSIEPQEDLIPVMAESGIFTNKALTIVPGLYKIFDEIIVNAADNKVRFPAETDTIKVTFEENGSISVWNNGRGIPVEMHPQYNVYAPELIFGNLLTSSNYDKKGKLTGGKNGLGAKLTNIYSTTFTVETMDSSRGKKYKQTWTENMYTKGKPKITQCKVKGDYTCITFTPDYERFGLKGLDEDHKSLFERRVYDLAATVKDTKIFLNGERIKIKTFKDYVKLYIGKESDAQILYEASDPRWEIAIAPNCSGQFQQVSFVNSIYTKNGGTHVNYIAKQITQAVTEKIEKGKNVKAGIVKPYHVKNQFWLFINCLVEDPAFSSQVKEEMTSIVSKWGSVPSFSKTFLDKLLKSQVITNTLEEVESKQNALIKKMDGSKKATVKDVDKLKDADYAGTRNAHKCVLFLTEGDSAKSMAISGFSALPFEDRKYYGVYPLRGKVLNVRDASVKQLLDNKETNELKKILGLQQNKEYTDTKNLRYGKVVLFTDADADGAHIKGLVINFFDHFYPSLLKLNHFLYEFITPIVKCFRNGQAPLSFYNLQEYESWCGQVNTKLFKVKYYKGLGTSTGEEAKVYFRALNNHLKSYNEMTDDDREQLDMVFRKKRAEDRKSWLASYNPKAFLDKSSGTYSVRDFIDFELIHFSHYDNIRSIPRLMDGLKPSQRKVLHTLFKYPIAEGGEVKVAQFANKVAEKTEYHHGEGSLAQTVVGLAQTFVGSNNLPLLHAGGQFGTRLLGGADAASPRYIFTNLLPHAKYIFKEQDSALLKKQYEDNTEIEPEYFMPIIPMILVNGAKGIGSGYSTDIPPFSPYDLVKILMDKLDGNTPDFENLKPYFHKFKGTIEKDPDTPDKFKHRGTYTYQKSKKLLTITELPIGTWVHNYTKDVLDKLSNDANSIVDGMYKDYSTEDNVHFEITVKQDMAEQDIVKKFELEGSFKTSNMVLFDDNFKIKKYANVQEIIEEYYQIRFNAYNDRKNHLLQIWQEELKVLDNKKRFIEGILNGTIDIRNKDNITVADLLAKVNLLTLNGSYSYLLGMAMSSQTKERVQSLQKEHAEKLLQIQILEAKSATDLWKEDLTSLLPFIEHYGVKEMSSAGSGTAAARRTSTASSKRGRSTSGLGNNLDRKETKRSKLSST
jgi:DNA topoisomerase II